jgi:predicted transposase YbfD/YdcC
MGESKEILVFFESFAELPDPRRAQGQRHKLLEILFIALSAVLCGADDFIEMEEFGHSRESWLRQYLELPHGIPSHDTFGRVFALLQPAAFEESFLKWARQLVELQPKEVVAIDGKTVRRSQDRSRGSEAIHVVSAWARENRLTLGEVKVSDKSNEIRAVPQLLKMLELKNCIVTADAMNCQKEIASEVREAGADYVLCLKDNHPTLHKEVERVFKAIEEDRTSGFTISRTSTLDKEHGRIEERRYCQINAPDYLYGYEEWADLKSIGMVESDREVEGKRSVERRYFLSSLEVEAEMFSSAVRGHWSIENSCHWVLDVVFREDHSRVRAGHAAENFARLRKIGNNLLQHDKSVKRGVKAKRFKAALDHSYLLKILTA